MEVCFNHAATFGDPYCVILFVCLQYNIKKKEAPPMEDPGLDGRLGRKKKTPEEMEAEANGELPPGATAGEGMCSDTDRHAADTRTRNSRCFLFLRRVLCICLAQCSMPRNYSSREQFVKKSAL